MCEGWLESALMRERERERVPKQLLELRERLEWVGEITRENLETNQVSQKQHYDC